MIFSKKRKNALTFGAKGSINASCAGRTPQGPDGAGFDNGTASAVDDGRTKGSRKDFFSEAAKKLLTARVVLTRFTPRNDDNASSG